MNFKLLSCSVAVGVLLVSCFDDKYNLDDIDTTSRISVNNLTIPVNFDEVLLDNIISIDEEDSDLQIIRTDNGSFYAIVRSGDFDSDDININPPHAKLENEMLSQQVTIPFVDGNFTIPKLGTDFTFDCDDVDASIVEIEKVSVDNLTFTLSLTTSIQAGKYQAIKVQLPYGMTGDSDTYDASTGVWTINELTISEGKAVATYTASSVDFTKNPGFSFESPKFMFVSEFSILSGTLIPDETPESIEFTADFKLSDELDVTAVTGSIMYDIDGMGIDPISIGDSLPEFLQGDDTNIKLANPLICLQLTNPLQDYGITYNASISLTPSREGESSETFTSDIFECGSTPSYADKYNFVMSPLAPEYVPEPYATNFSHVVYKNLGDIVAGKGLPESIAVNVNNPSMPRQHVSDFILGDYPGVVGSYELFAPLALDLGSTIVYSTTKDGWNDDIEGLTINLLKITAEATNNTPLDAVISVYPIDVDGNVVEGIKVTSAVLPYKAVNSPVEFLISKEGGISNLDGIKFEARIEPGSNQTLSPDQTIVFKKVRATVDGYYEKKL